MHDLSLQINTGEVVGLLGPNGAGKTTAFYMIVGLVRADGGSIALDDQRPHRCPCIDQRARLGVGYLPQEASVFRRLSVADNILAILETARRPRRARARRAGCEELLERAAHRPRARQRSAWRCRAASAGAWRSRARWRPSRASSCWTSPSRASIRCRCPTSSSIVRELAARGIGVLITDHNVRETLGVCDRAYIVDRGTVIASGTAEEILANPQVREVYLGQNFPHVNCL